MKGSSMKARNSRSTERDENDMRPEYDFGKMKGGVRGKYYQAYRAGHSVKIHKDDGTTVVQHFKLEDGAVMLEPDVRKYFPDSDAVNKALRSLIGLIPKKRVSSHTKQQAG
ncbi:MAG: hypothetical protein AB1512_18150 [Thermodesulfobacteriota bacterium]